MTFDEAEKKAAEYDKTLKATDKRFRRCVRVIIDDGSVFHWDSAFAVWLADPEQATAKGYFGIFTEHHRFYVFDPSDVVECRVYQELHDRLEQVK